ncbi:MAG: TlyA family RNA methyltransferase [Pseudomonadota bacterium]
MADKGASEDVKQRLDVLITQAGYFPTRSRARDAIVRGTVSVNGEPCLRPGARFDADASFTVEDSAHGYVSRGALKLLAGLDHFGFDPSGRTVIDIGMSTGGFSQALLERGAAHVIGIDVGRDQLHPSLKTHPGLTCIEGLNARDLDVDVTQGRPIEAIVCDVSFISMKLALPPALDMAQTDSFCVLLVKPQFEAGRQAIGKGGLLKDRSLGPKIAGELSQWLETVPGWQSKGFVVSPIEGGDGNEEFLLGGLKR